MKTLGCVSGILCQFIGLREKQETPRFGGKKNDGFL